MREIYAFFNRIFPGSFNVIIKKKKKKSFVGMGNIKTSFKGIKKNKTKKKLEGLLNPAT